MRKRDRLTVLGMALYCGVVFCVFLAWGMHSEAMDIPEPEVPKIAETHLNNYADPIHAEPLVHITPETVEPLEYQDEIVELPAVNVIEDCTITYYCAERWAHICGTGDGITATGETVTPGVTCAVDPTVIPYGSVVMIDYGDGVLHEYAAQDAGAIVSGAHIDVCVESHSQALELGRRTATVYWSVPEDAL